MEKFLLSYLNYTTCSGALARYTGSSFEQGDVPAVTEFAVS